MNDFGQDIVNLCRELEQWRAECRRDRENDPNDFPPFERKAGFQSLALFIAFLITSYLFPYVREQHSTLASLAAALSLLISAVAAPLLFIFQAIGLAKRQFWHAALRLFTTPKGNYPFSSLIYCVEHDATQEARLASHTTTVLATTLDRIGHEESELRERLNILVGNPTVFVLLGSITGIVTAWENYNVQPDSMLTPALFMGSICALLMGFLGFKWRISLTELMRCRALLALEIAKRQAEIASPSPRRRNRRRSKHSQSTTAVPAQ